MTTNNELIIKAATWQLSIIVIAIIFGTCMYAGITIGGTIGIIIWLAGLIVGLIAGIITMKQSKPYIEKIFSKPEQNND